MNETKARSTASGNYLLGNSIKFGKLIVLNSAVHTLCKIIGVAASAAEAELGSIFLNTQDTVKLCIALQELVHTHTPTHIHTDNTKEMVIIHKKINQQQSRAMNTRYFWTISKQDEKTIDVSWHPGRENIADYSSKHYSPTIHKNIRPTYLHIPNSRRYIQRSVTPHLLRECAKTSPHSVLCTNVLPYRGMVPTLVQNNRDVT